MTPWARVVDVVEGGADAVGCRGPLTAMPANDLKKHPEGAKPSEACHGLFGSSRHEESFHDFILKNCVFIVFLSFSVFFSEMFRCLKKS